MEQHAQECSILQGILGTNVEHGELPENFYTCPKCSMPIAQSDRFDHEFAHELEANTE
jgi:hypothetical protein